LGAKVTAVSDDLVEVALPPSEHGFFASRPRFGERGVLRVGMTLKALETEPEAELAVVGSPLFEHLVDAIRARGHRMNMGLVPPTLSPAAEAAQLDIPIHAATPSLPEVTTAIHPVGRLLVRVLVRAGAAAEELLVESALFDLAAGRPLDPAIAELCKPDGPVANEATGIARRLPEQQVDRLLSLMI
jgi:hypothetical protein